MTVQLYAVNGNAIWNTGEFRRWGVDLFRLRRQERGRGHADAPPLGRAQGAWVSSGLATRSHPPGPLAQLTREAPDGK